ncbi:hypothetical protein TSOC_005683, partial [Tetrabaena socialis]
MAPKEGKRRYINYRVDAYLRDRFLIPRGTKRYSCGNGESLLRFFNHVKFCIVCCASLSQAVAPWMLCGVEVLAVLLIYFLATSRSLVIHHHHFSFTRSLEDIVGLSCARAGILSIAYAIGQRSVHRPYLYCAYLLSAACFPYTIVKTILFRYGSDGVAAAFILGLCGVCSLLHILAARRTVDWARRRYQMGLAGFGMPWEEGEEAWMMMRRPDLEDMTKTSDGGGPESGGEDVPAEMLADDDSRFVEIAPGLKIHYKEVAPPAPAAHEGPAGQGRGLGGGGSGGGREWATTGIVLVHGFGGGVFAWRHVMEALALQCRCRVIAFDRPAFGLTSRPKATGQSNPYTVASQSQLVLQLCAALGLRRVVLVAHADGCLVALRAAAMSASLYQQQGIFVPPHPLAGPQHAAQQQQAPSAFAKAAEHARSAPPSADSSPKLTCGSPSSPSHDQQYQHHQQQLQLQLQGLQQQQQVQLGLGGAVSAAAVAAAAAAGDAAAQAQMCISPQTGGVAQGPSPERDRAADDVVRACSYHGVTASAFTAGKSQPHHSGNSPVLHPPGAPGNHHNGHSHHSHHLTLHHLNHHNGHNLAALACCGPAASCLPASSAGGGDVEAGAASTGRCEAATEPDRASATSTSVAAAAASQAHHRRAQSMPAPPGAAHCCSSSRSSDGWEAPGSSFCCAPPPSASAHPPVESVPYVLGLVLLHPNLSGAMGPALSRILARSQLGRSILRPLLRTEVGEVANRRAWHNSDKLTSEVLELYKTPLRVEGWDRSLMEVTRLRREACQGDLPACFAAVQSIPTLLATGEHDRIVPPSKSEALAADLPQARLAVLHDCGHLSHEEAPGVEGEP